MAYGSLGRDTGGFWKKVIAAFYKCPPAALLSIFGLSHILQVCSFALNLSALHSDTSKTPLLLNICFEIAHICSFFFLHKFPHYGNTAQRQIFFYKINYEYCQ
jgi:hypothetical protein